MNNLVDNSYEEIEKLKNTLKPGNLTWMGLVLEIRDNHAKNDPDHVWHGKPYGDQLVLVLPFGAATPRWVPIETVLRRSRK